LAGVLRFEIPELSCERIYDTTILNLCRLVKYI